MTRRPAGWVVDASSGTCTPQALARPAATPRLVPAAGVVPGSGWVLFLTTLSTVTFFVVTYMHHMQRHRMRRRNLHAGWGLLACACSLAPPVLLLHQALAGLGALPALRNIVNPAAMQRWRERFGNAQPLLPPLAANSARL